MDDYAPVVFNHTTFSCTVRTKKCVNVGKARKVAGHVGLLMKLSSKVNTRLLNTPEKKSRIISTRYHNSRRNTVNRVYIRIWLIQCIKEFSANVESTYPEGSFARLFWNEQVKKTQDKYAGTR